MLHLAARLGLQVNAVTVDHGLRPEAAAEAAQVGRVCARLGVPHEVLHWHWDGRGNLQGAARLGRRAVMSAWARDAGLGAVALAHTRDDVAETFLMRLARGAGVDGLAAMATRWDEGAVTWLRPLLAVSREELRDYLRGIGATWVEDPSNDNDRFDRVRVRKALAGLQGLGLTTARLAEVAGHLAQAREALERATDAAAVRVLATKDNAVRIDAVALAIESAEVQRRLLLRVITFVAPAEYGPRGAALQALLVRVLAGKPAMLAGCRFVGGVSGVWAFRESKTAAGLTAEPSQPWDGKWRIEGPMPDGVEVRILGAGIVQCPDWRATGLPRAAVMVGPALWLQERLIAAPLAGFGQGYSAKPLFGATALHHSVISH